MLVLSRIILDGSNLALDLLFIFVGVSIAGFFFAGVDDLIYAVLFTGVDSLCAFSFVFCTLALAETFELSDPCFCLLTVLVSRLLIGCGLINLSLSFDSLVVSLSEVFLLVELACL